MGRNHNRSIRSIKHKVETFTLEKRFKTPNSSPKLGQKDDQSRITCSMSDETEWGYCTEVELEGLLLKSLDNVYQEAITKLVSLGYTEEIAEKAILWNGNCYGDYDVRSNIVHNALAFLSGNVKLEEPEMVFADLRDLEIYSAACMVSVLQKVRPGLSKGDAMWCLVMTDLDMDAASTIEVPFGTPASGGVPDSNNLNGIEPENCRFHGGWGFASGEGFDFSGKVSEVVREIECPKRFDLPPSLEAMLQRNVSLFAAGFRANTKMTGVKQQILRRSAAGVTLEPKVPTEKEGFNVNAETIVTKPYVDTIRDSIEPEVPPKTSEGSKANARPTAVRSFGKVVRVPLERNDQPENSEGFKVNAKPAVKRAHLVEKSDVEVPVSDVATEKSEGLQDSQTSDVNSVLSSMGNLTLDEKVEGGVPDKKTEMILNLIHQIKDLEVQVKERKEWAHHKAVQAAKKLSQDMTELKLLKMEREETQRLKKGKQTLEDKTTKRLSEMENALRKASGQVDRANTAVRKLEIENAEIRAEMEAFKLSASESVATSLEVAKREKKHLKKVVSWEKQKTKLQEEVMEEKQKIFRLEEQLVLIKATQKETEVNWRQELKGKELSIARVEEERRSKEAAEVSAKKKAETLRRKIELDFQRHKDDIQRLEQEISRLKASDESTQANYTNTAQTGDSDTANNLSKTNARRLHELNQLQESSDNEVDYDRDCMICMKTEVSVVFLPCAHQVLCASCSQTFGKKGKANCPCCGVHIEQRISVYGASS